MTLSVVIPALNEAANLSELLPLLRGQSRPPDEIFVAEAGSTDDTAAVAERCGARLVPGGRPAHGRNHGAREASGEWVFFLDADTRPPDGEFIARVLEELDRRRLAAAVCDCRAYYRPGDRGHDRPWLRAWDRLLMAGQNGGVRAWHGRGFPVGLAVFMAVRREEFLSLGGFRGEVEPYEDSEYLLRAHRALTPAPGQGSAVGVLAPSTQVLISMRRYDVKGRVVFPLWMGFRGSFLRWALGRELPQPDYWDLNRRGFGSAKGPDDAG